MSKQEKTCLSCKKFRVIDNETGLCRLVKKEKVEDYPVKKHTDSCEEYKNCGQQLYIRLGWLKKQELKAAAN